MYNIQPFRTPLDNCFNIVADEEVAVDSHSADKTVFEKENSEQHSQKIQDKRVASLEKAMLKKVVDVKTKPDWILKFQL